MSEIRTFEDLEVWKRGCNLAVDLHVAVAESKDFAVRNQMERASLSIPSNIAEGAERDTTPDFIRFLRYSKGSCGELRTQLYVSERIRQRLGAPPIPESKGMIQETREPFPHDPSPHHLPPKPPNAKKNNPPTHQTTTH